MRPLILLRPSRPEILEVHVGRVQLALRAALAAGISLQLAAATGLPFPLYAMIAAVLVTDLLPAQTRQLGLRRLVATVVGAACGALLGGVLPPSPWSVAAGVLLAMLASVVLNAPDAAKVAGYICGIVLLGHAQERWEYAVHRFLETALGIAVAWTISLVPRLVQIGARTPPTARGAS